MGELRNPSDLIKIFFVSEIFPPSPPPFLQQFPDHPHLRSDKCNDHWIIGLFNDSFFYGV